MDGYELTILIGIGGSIALGGIYLVYFAPSNNLYERWPAIDDDEFLRRCSPGTNREVALKIRQILEDATGIDEKHIHPDQRLFDLDVR